MSFLFVNFPWMCITSVASPSSAGHCHLKSMGCNSMHIIYIFWLCLPVGVCKCFNCHLNEASLLFYLIKAVLWLSHPCFDLFVPGVCPCISETLIQFKSVQKWCVGLWVSMLLGFMVSGCFWEHLKETWGFRPTPLANMQSGNDVNIYSQIANTFSECSKTWHKF